MVWSGPGVICFSLTASNLAFILVAGAGSNGLDNFSQTSWCISQNGCCPETNTKGGDIECDVRRTDTKETRDHQGTLFVVFAPSLFQDIFLNGSHIATH